MSVTQIFQKKKLATRADVKREATAPTPFGPLAAQNAPPARRIRRTARARWCLARRRSVREKNDVRSGATTNKSFDIVYS